MRVSFTTGARDISRLCTRCRQQATMARPSAMLAAANSSRAATHMRWSSGLSTSANQKRWISGTVPLFRPAAPARSSETTDSGSQESKPRMTHYEFFPITLPDGPPPKGHFPIDQRALRREFLRLQAKAHPDMHPAELKARAEATSARINEAYKTLSNPLLRAQYLLSLRGVDVANDETLKVEDPDLLMIVLEAREEIEEAASESELEGQRAANDERIRESEEVLEEAFRHDDIETAKREAVKLRYWVNIQESLNNWEAGKPIVLQH
ncbi:Putative DnaJ domain, co-chaperone Hsc20, co-chaperone HscB oligomerization [Colletotrichum destructivum]|uniref:DnaJ domain, co-chaperone Hsc20, co-chaperone HscB oligomerization n=1 Tax=Colletotrichum destructivum TaxID=34406 RepID=A0AAX4I3Z6_9PEZI|nr:Putative DnaJ domain, co-chaperone Hsc20, co-chaperone HscB oligomerization [Colletotrichum destructivum]